MYLSRVRIKNFRNFKSLDVHLDRHVVLVGENRVGKSNFIHAIRLVLDSTLPDSARHLRLADIWDGLTLADSPTVEVHLTFSDFEDDPAECALLTDFRTPLNPKLAKLSYVFRKREDIAEEPKSESDFEFKVYGAGDETRYVRPDVRRRICLEVLHALRDAEAQLGTWRSSPLRPLIEDAIGQVEEDDLNEVAASAQEVTDKLSELEPIKELEDSVRTRVADLSGVSQDIKAKLGFNPTDPIRLLRSIRLLIDDGKRTIGDASVGSANLALLAIKLAEFEWRHERNERNHTIICIEEPEAHLHPHLQRQVFRKLFSQEVEGEEQASKGIMLTTHSPSIASVAPIKSLVLLKRSDNGTCTIAHSVARLSLSEADQEDIQRYLDATRAEILFARGIIFVEGDAEATLLPVFAKAMGVDLDDLGISICNVGGVNFSPYVKLAACLGLPFAVITDWDPSPGETPLGQKRAIKIIDAIRKVSGEAVLTAAEKAALEANAANLRVQAEAKNIFLNASTLELELATDDDSLDVLIKVLKDCNLGARRKKRLTDWEADHDVVKGEQLMAMIATVGKGRFAGRVADAGDSLDPPDYIKKAIQSVVDRVE